MKHIVNANLPKDDYRVICTKCNNVYIQGQGDFTQANIAAMKYKSICKLCGGEVVLETNPY